MRPNVYYNSRRKRWELNEDYRDSIFPYVIPKSFTCDLASIPRFLWSIIAPFELSEAAPLVHDFCYKHPNKYGNRKTADKYFRDIMRREGVPYWKRLVAYRAVRMFAGSVWRKRL